MNLNEHTKTLMRAILDGKQIERLCPHGPIIISTELALKYIAADYCVDELGVAPERRTINGMSFPVPNLKQGGYALQLSVSGRAWKEYLWKDQADADLAYDAIVAAMEGRTV